MDLRHVASGFFIYVMLIPLVAHADRPDGLDCGEYPQIPAERCQDWKTQNASGRWWCKWDLNDGSMKAVFGHRSEPVVPGLDLTNITRESARSDTATRTLLEAYVRQHIRQNESLFGFKPHGYELQLIDFQRRPAGVHRKIQPDGSILEEVVPAVTTIHVQQVLKNGTRVAGATIEIQVDDEDRLVSMFSNFLTDVPANIPSHTVTSDQAVAVALTAVAPGETPTGEEFAVAIPTYDMIGVDLRPLYRVSISLDSPGLDQVVVVDGLSGAVLSAHDQQDDDHTETLPAFDGFHHIDARVFPDHPTLEEASGTYPGASPADFVAGLGDSRLRYVRNPLDKLQGFFARVVNEEQPAWESNGGLVPLMPVDNWTMLIDHNPGNESAAPGCRSPDAVEDINREFESRFDEISAYYHITNAAVHFLLRHHHLLGRSGYASPDIKTSVNSIVYGLQVNAHFRSRCNGSECKPIILFDRSPCRRMLGLGDDVPFGSGFVDFYSVVDQSRDRNVAWHEFTHAINWDVSPIDTDSPGEDFDDAGGAFKEAVADFFPNSIFDRSMLSPWSNQREINPILAGIEEDLAYPYEDVFDIEGNKHEKGRVWSGFLWDLRERAIDMQEQLQTLENGPKAVEDLQFEALTRMPERVKGFHTALRRLFDADAAINGKQLSYDIAASAARHGIKIADRISAVQPSRYATASDTPLLFTVYSGRNDSMVFEAATDPALLGTGVEGDARYFRAACGFSVFSGCSMDRIQHADDGENLQTVVEIMPDALNGLLAGEQSVTVFYRVTTSRFVAVGHDNADVIVSDIPDAGTSWQHPDLPSVVVTAPGAPTPPPCFLSLLLVGSVIATGAVAGRRRPS